MQHWMMTHMNAKELSMDSLMGRNARNLLGLRRVGLGVSFPILVWILSNCAEAQIPAKQDSDGFWYGGKTSISDSVLIEAFFDPVCPDSRDSWPPLKKAIQHYASSDIMLVVRPFSLPYHDNSFISSRALHIVNKLNASATYAVMEQIFNHQKQFYGSATVKESRASVVDEMVKFVTQVVGTSYGDAVKSGFSDTETDRTTRISFKHGCLRGVYGTPFFFVNGFPLSDAAILDYEGWRRVLDPLITNTGTADQ